MAEEPTDATRSVPEDAPGWAAPPRADPPPAPFPTGPGAVGASRASRKRKGGLGALFAFLVLTGGRFLLANADDPSNNTIAVPDRPQGPSVPGVVLSGDEVCALVRPGQLERIYGVAFEAGEAGQDVTTGGGEPSDDEATLGSCRWRAEDGAAGALTVQILSIGPLLRDDANATYEALRPSSPAQAFDDTSGIADEAFFLVGSSAPTGGSLDSMTLRDGGVILTVAATAGIEPEGGLDSLAEVARTAVTSIPRR
jgi:hypothetical protein